MDNKKAPSFTVDFSNARTKYNYGDRVYTINFEWYNEFKPLGDNIIILFSYLAFVFNCFKRLPDIISGAGAVTHSVNNFNEKQIKAQLKKGGK